LKLLKHWKCAPPELTTNVLVQNDNLFFSKQWNQLVARRERQKAFSRLSATYRFSSRLISDGGAIRRNSNEDGSPRVVAEFR